MDSLKTILRLTILTSCVAFIWLLLHGEIYTGYLESRFTPSITFILRIVVSFIINGSFMALFVYVLYRRESKVSFSTFYRIERLDIKGIWLTLALGLGIQLINVAFLYKLFLEPARSFILSLGVFGGRIGLGSGEAVPQLAPLEALFLTFFLLIFWWIEVPEELFYRGYLQSKAQEAVGKNWAMLISALLWDASHLWGLVNIVERFIYGLIYGFIFRIRQNTTATMIPHPTGNRALLLATIIPQIWGTTLQSPYQWLLLLFLYFVLPSIVIKAWKAYSHKALMST